MTAAELKRHFDLDVSKSTICRALKATGLISAFETKKPFLNSEARTKRLKWAKEHEHWDVSRWRRVFFTDESPFALRFQGRQRIWRSPNEKYHPECVKGIIKHDGKINVWAGFSYNGVGAFHRVEGIMVKEQYLSIVDKVGLPSALALLGNRCIWLQDNDPKHTSNIVKEFFAEQRELGICYLLDWPSWSPDLNPIENLWHHVDVIAKARTCNNKEDLFRELEKAWESISVDYLRKLVDSMPARIQAVIKAKGGNTKY